MPHLLIERVRAVPALAQCRLVRPKGRIQGGDGTTCGCLVESMDILGALIFLAGSVCILPGPQRTLEVFLAGCWLFILGGFVYFGLHILTFYEAWLEQGWGPEAVENALYVGGSLVFLIGTVYYWPEEAHHAHMEWLKQLSVGTQFNLFTAQFEGTLLFIAGSVLFGFAALVNGMNQKSNLLIATTRMYLLGSLLFVVGSVLFLPGLGYALGWGRMEAAGAWCFIIGSALYVIGGLLNLARTMTTPGSTDETTPLVGEASSCESQLPRKTPPRTPASPRRPEMA